MINHKFKISSLGERINLNKEDYKKLKLDSLNGYVLVGNYLVKLSTKSKSEKTSYYLESIGSRMKVTKKYRDIDTGLFKIELEVFDGDDIAVLICDRDVLTKNGCKELIKFGANFNDNKADDIINYLIYSDDKAPIVDSYSQLGWCENGFKTSTYISRTDENNEKVYVGGLDLQESGKIESYLTMLKQEVVGNTGLEFAFLLGISAPIFSYISKIYDLGTMVINFANASSKGKTTAAMLAVSAMCNPLMDKAMLTSFNTTSNALIKFLSLGNGHTIAVDEVGLSEKRSLRNQLYLICNGRDKKRLSADSTLKPQESFNSIVITTAEFEIIDSTAPNGIRARVFEIKEPLTTSSQNSDSIKKTVLKNYGLVGKDFVKFIVQNKLELIEPDYEECKKYLISLVKNCGELTDRIMSKFATLLLTLKYFNEFSVKIKLSEKQITNFLINIEKNISSQTSIEDRFLEAISEFSAMKNCQFQIEKNGYVPANVIGRLEVESDYYIVSLSKEVVEKLAESKGFINLKKIIEVLKGKKLMICESDRNYKRISFSSEIPKLPCYVFKLKKDDKLEKVYEN